MQRDQYCLTLEWSYPGSSLVKGGSTGRGLCVPVGLPLFICSVCLTLPHAICKQVRERFPEMDEVLDPYRLPEVLRHNMADTIKRGQVLDEDPTFIMVRWGAGVTATRDLLLPSQATAYLLLTSAVITMQQCCSAAA